MMRRLFVLTALAACACRPHESLPYFNSAAFAPEWLSSSEAHRASVHRVAPFMMRDQDSALVTQAALTGRITVIHFFSAKCGDICPTTHQQIAGLLRELPNAPQVQVLSFSVAPERDTVAALREYARMRNIRDARWHLLTGSRADVERLAKESFFVRIGADSTYGGRSIRHTENLLLIDGEGHIRGVYAGTLAIEAAQLKADIETLLANRG